VNASDSAPLSRTRRPRRKFQDLARDKTMNPRQPSHALESRGDGNT
jgi:hypothetical protein